MQLTEQDFIECKLNPSDFSHEAHLRLAWINIDRYGIEQAEKNIQNQLRKFFSYRLLYCTLYKTD